jgi:hypothetical protein
MAEGHNHVEEAEHHSHAVANPFDRRIALTMVIIAAALAVVRVVGHRAHNDTLRLQIESNVKHTKESDQWAFFQAQKIRQHVYEGQLKVLDITAQDKPFGDAAKARIADLKNKADEYQKKAEGIQKEATALGKEGDELQQQSVDMHHRTNYYDLGEMAIEISLVLCSLAILIRQPGFWYAGIAVALLGVLISSIGLLPIHATGGHGTSDQHGRRLLRPPERAEST